MTAFDFYILLFFVVWGWLLWQGAQTDKRERERRAGRKK